MLTLEKGKLVRTLPANADGPAAKDTNFRVVVGATGTYRLIWLRDGERFCSRDLHKKPLEGKPTGAELLKAVEDWKLSASEQALLLEYIGPVQD